MNIHFPMDICYISQWRVPKVLQYPSCFVTLEIIQIVLKYFLKESLSCWLSTILWSYVIPNLTSASHPQPCSQLPIWGIMWISLLKTTLKLPSSVSAPEWAIATLLSSEFLQAFNITPDLLIRKEARVLSKLLKHIKRYLTSDPSTMQKHPNLTVSIDRDKWSQNSQNKSVSWTEKNMVGIKLLKFQI